ncbi:TPA: hypothetical protein DIU22_00830 [Candidatus Woesebacteria bacterium]|nr:MAG: hypothetical protein UR41_C0020G0010 [Candidatus Woesebacteria bacterium GW2011_GWA1_33_33]HCR35577.1 hypothetical protein [Candidatus Woesebacteria bacterium]
MTNKNIVTKEDLSLVETEVSLAEKAAQIKTDVDVENAAEVLISLKTQVDAIEEKRKEYTQPAQETIDRINDDFKQLTKPRMSYITMLKEKIVEYVSIRKKEISSKEKELQIELKDRSLVLDNGLNKIVCSTGELRFRKSVDVKVTNRNIVPEKYWILDEKTIEKDLDAGIEIPGVKIKINPIASVAIYADK